MPTLFFQFFRLKPWNYPWLLSFPSTSYSSHQEILLVLSIKYIQNLSFTATTLIWDTIISHLNYAITFKMISASSLGPSSSPPICSQHISPIPFFFFKLCSMRELPPSGIKPKHPLQWKCRVFPPDHEGSPNNALRRSVSSFTHLLKTLHWLSVSLRGKVIVKQIMSVTSATNFATCSLCSNQTGFAATPILHVLTVPSAGEILARYPHLLQVFTPSSPSP